MTEFMEKSLENPLIASSCIATETAGSILKLAEYGVQGAILKSCADYTREAFTRKREFAREQGTDFLYASSPFQMEILTLTECLSLMAELRPKTNILLIPSFTATDLRPESWIPACQALAGASADGIQLDFFYMGNLIGQEGFIPRMTELLRCLRKEVSVPIMPKLNINLPKDFIMPVLKDAGMQYVSLLDSVRSPYVRRNTDGNFRLDSRLDPLTTSCFGAWQFPLTMSYAYTAVQNGLNVCAGGGITNAENVQKLLALGVSTVQSATFLTKYPHKAGMLLSG